jgi:hypothetical protein
MGMSHLKVYYSQVYWRLNMFRAARRSSSGALNCICSLWFIYTCGDWPLPRLSGNTPTHVEPSVNFGIINSITRLHLVGYFYRFILRCTDPWILKKKKMNVLTDWLQVLGKVPTISIDKTDGCQMYLSPESLNVEIITSKSSEMNVLVPKGNGDYVSTSVNL